MQDQTTDLKRLTKPDVKDHPLRGLPIMSGIETQEERSEWLKQLKNDHKLLTVYAKKPESKDVKERN